MAVNSFNAQNPPVNTKGDVFTFSTIPTRLGVGANDTVLTADSAQTTGLKWAAVAGWNPNYQLINAGGTNLTGATTITVSSISGKNSLLIYVNGGSSASASSSFRLQLNSDTGSNYTSGAVGLKGTAVNTNWTGTSTFVDLATMGNAAGDTISGFIQIDGTNASGLKPISFCFRATGATTNESYNGQGYYSGSSAISSVSLISTSGNFDAGTIFVYGA